MHFSTPAISFMFGHLGVSCVRADEKGWVLWASVDTLRGSSQTDGIMSGSVELRSAKELRLVGELRPGPSEVDRTSDEPWSKLLFMKPSRPLTRTERIPTYSPSRES